MCRRKDAATWSSFRCKVVRDLVWSIASPSMVPSRVDTSRLLTERTLQWLRKLDENPSELVEFLGEPRRRAKRIGFYMSALIEFFILRSPCLKTTNLVCGRQVREGERVVGALKFVFECQPRDVEVRRTLGAREDDDDDTMLCHWECSVKFFVRDHRRFVGPYLSETLEDRLRACANKRTLSRLDAVTRWTSREFGGGRKRLHFAGIVRGYLFYEGSSSSSSPSGDFQHDKIAKNHLRGSWARSVDELSKLLEGNEKKIWVILTKPFWLSPCVARLDDKRNSFVVPAVPEIGAHEPLESFTFNRLRYKLQATCRECPPEPIMLAVLEPDDDRDPRRAVETSRGFLLPPGWESSTTPSSVHHPSSSELNQLPHEFLAMHQNAELLEVEGDDYEIAAAENPRGLVQSLVGRRKSSGQLLKNLDHLRDRARALLEATSDEMNVDVGPLAVACCRKLSPDFKRADATLLGFALLEAAATSAGSSSCRCREADDFYVEACLGTFRYFEIGIKCCELLAIEKERLESREFAAAKLINASDKVSLETAAKLVVLRGRDSNSLPTPDLCAAVRRLVQTGALRAAELLATDDASDDCEDLVEARHAFIAECRELGHANLATKLERKWFQPGRQQSLTLTQRVTTTTIATPPVWIRSDALETTEDSLLRLGASISVRFTTIFCEDDLTDVVGMDVEWPHDDRTAPPSLLQLATTNHEVIVYDLPNMTQNGRGALSAFLSSSKTVVLAFSVKGDIHRLQQYPGFFDSLRLDGSSRIIDLQTEKSISLSGLCKRKLGFGLCKKFQCADWKVRPVQQHLLHYAALDAFALLAVASTDKVAFVERSMPTDLEHSDAVKTKSLALVAVKERWMRLVVVLPLDARLCLDKVAGIQGGRRYRFADTGTELVARFGAPRGYIGPVGPRAPLIFHDTLQGRIVSCGSGTLERSAVFAASTAALSEWVGEEEAVVFADVALSS